MPAQLTLDRLSAGTAEPTGRGRLRGGSYRIRRFIAETNYAPRRLTETHAPWIVDPRSDGR
jgi:hypothetical protein